MAFRRTGAATIAALVVLSATSPAYAVPSGSFTGRTAQKRTVTFRVSKGKVRQFSFRARFGCSDGSGFTAGDSFTIRLRGARFRGTFATKDGALRTTISGTFKGRRASGTIRRTARFDANRHLAPGGALRCTIRTRFTARHR